MSPFFRSVLLLARSSGGGVLAWLRAVATCSGEFEAAAPLVDSASALCKHADMGLAAVTHECLS